MENDNKETENNSGKLTSSEEVDIDKIVEEYRKKKALQQTEEKIRNVKPGQKVVKKKKKKKKKSTFKMPKVDFSFVKNIKLPKIEKKTDHTNEFADDVTYEALNPSTVSEVARVTPPSPNDGNNGGTIYFEEKKWQRVCANIVVVVVIVGIVGVIASAIFAGVLLKDKPDFDSQKLTAADSTIIYDSEGNEVVELGLYLRENIEYEELPNSLIDAFLSIEDSRFFEHFGFDIPRFTMAILSNLRSGGFGQGGSTITMQLIKNSYFQVDDDGASTMAAASGLAGVKRKMQEIVLAIEADKELDKKEIITLYLNKINFGNNIRGVQKAAQYYFGKDASELNLSESAFLAGLINSPNYVNPYNNLYKNNENYTYLNSDVDYLANGQERMDEVINLMLQHGYITKDEAALAKSIKLENLISGTTEKFDSYSTYYQDYIDAVIEEAEEVSGLDPYTTPMKIYTNMDTYMQETIYNIENEKVEGLKYTNDLEQSALVVLNNQTGELVALGGGRNNNEGSRQFNRATSAYLQPGSTIKPVLEYALAFDRLGWSTVHTLTDQPIYLYGGNILVSNAGSQGYSGDMLITEAIARSLNTPAIQTLEAVLEEMDTEEVVDYLKSIGFTTNLDSFDLQWAIGGNTCVCTPVQLAAAHAIFMNEGYYVTPHTIKSIEYYDGTTYTADTTGNQVISSAAAYMMATCLEYNVSGPYYNNMQILKQSYPVYAKTGTTDYSNAGSAYGIPYGSPKDMWLTAQTSNYTVTVWLGFDKMEKGAYFTSSEDMANLKGKIGKYIIETLAEHFDYDTSGVKRPDDVSDVTIVKGAYPYCYDDGAHETVTGLIKTSALEETPLTSVDEVLANLPDKEYYGNATGISGYVEDGVAKISIHSGGYYCSDGTQDLTATNYNGDVTAASGTCYFPHYRTTAAESSYAHVGIIVNGEFLKDAYGENYIETYDIPSEGKVEACIIGDDGSQQDCVTLRD